MRFRVLLDAHFEVGEHFQGIRNPVVIILIKVFQVFRIICILPIFFKERKAVAYTSLIEKPSSRSHIMAKPDFLKCGIILEHRTQPAQVRYEVPDFKGCNVPQMFEKTGIHKAACFYFVAECVNRIGVNIFPAPVPYEFSWGRGGIRPIYFLIKIAQAGKQFLPCDGIVCPADRPVARGKHGHNHIRFFLIVVLGDVFRETYRLVYHFPNTADFRKCVKVSRNLFHLALTFLTNSITVENLTLVIL